MIVGRLRHICGLPTIVVEDAAMVAQAITWYEEGMDVAALHLAQSATCTGFATMDRRLMTAGARLTGRCPLREVARYPSLYQAGKQRQKQ